MPGSVFVRGILGGVVGASLVLLVFAVVHLAPTTFNPLTTQEFFTFLAVIVAAAALSTNAWDGFRRRRHDRLSVKPYLRIDRFTYLNSHPTVVVTNVGIGPAFVDRYWVALDGDEVKRDKFPAASEAVKKLDIHDKVNTYTPEGTDVLSPRENWTLLEIHNAPTDIDTTGALATQLKRIRFDIEYHSIYGERDSTNK